MTTSMPLFATAESASGQTAIEVFVPGTPVVQGDLKPFRFWPRGVKDDLIRQLRLELQVPEANRESAERRARKIIDEISNAQQVRLHHANGDELERWRRLVEMLASQVWTRGPLSGPVELSVGFVFERPKTVRRAWPSVRPDMDKLLRAVGDALTGTVLVDDSQIVRMREVEKSYGKTPGVRIRVVELLS